MMSGKKSEKVVEKKVKSNGASKWLSHVAAYRSENKCSYKEALKGAKETYNK